MERDRDRPRSGLQLPRRNGFGWAYAYAERDWVERPGADGSLLDGACRRRCSGGKRPSAVCRQHQ
jgi:hypothetical protein